MESACFTSGDFQRRERKGRIDEVRTTIVGGGIKKNDSAIANRFKLQRKKKINKCVKSLTFPDEFSTGFQWDFRTFF